MRTYGTPEARILGGLIGDYDSVINDLSVAEKNIVRNIHNLVFCPT